MNANLSESAATETAGKVERSPAELTVIIVTWNTRELTMRCLESLFDNTPDLAMRVIVADNHSEDGSAEAIAEGFPQVDLIRNPSNFGFACANNGAMEVVRSEWVLLLNPDTKVHLNAINNLLSFSKQHPEAGVTGGRTVFPDGSLNPASAWNKMTTWSLFCFLTGLNRLLKHSEIFNPEAIGGWKRDTVRHVDIVQGSFFMFPTALWTRLRGFDRRYFMYGEEADMCLRAAALGYCPMITPDAEIMHLGGASAPEGVRMLQNWTSKTTLIRDHWPKALVTVGLFELWLSCANRAVAAAALAKLSGRTSRNDDWSLMWAKRHEWMKGYS
jgi:N-acetylglucosaminyl-diphospho-decaprenol L-rhamnosyltransferase